MEIILGGKELSLFFSRVSLSYILISPLSFSHLSLSLSLHLLFPSPSTLLSLFYLYSTTYWTFFPLSTSSLSLSLLSLSHSFLFPSFIHPNHTTLNHTSRCPTTSCLNRKTLNPIPPKPVASLRAPDGRVERRTMTRHQTKIMLPTRRNRPRRAVSEIPPSPPRLLPRLRAKSPSWTIPVRHQSSSSLNHNLNSNPSSNPSSNHHLSNNHNSNN